MLCRKLPIRVVSPRKRRCPGSYALLRKLSILKRRPSCPMRSRDWKTGPALSHLIASAMHNSNGADEQENQRDQELAQTPHLLCGAPPLDTPMGSGLSRTAHLRKVKAGLRRTL